MVAKNKEYNRNTAGVKDNYYFRKLVRNRAEGTIAKYFIGVSKAGK